MNESEKTNKEKETSLIEDILYYFILAFLLAISCSMIWQKIADPEKIPDLFGYKMFVVVDDKMDEALSYGDLVISKNVECKNLKVGDLVAFRNTMNTVTVHKIASITEENDEKAFTMQAAENEVGNIKNVNEKAIEGIITGILGRVGLIILVMQNPYIFISLLCIVLSYGLIMYYRAQEIDKKNSPEENEEEKNTEQDNTEQNNTEDREENTDDEGNEEENIEEENKEDTIEENKTEKETSDEDIENTEEKNMSETEENSY